MRLFKDTRGLAMVEAVMVLPVFIAVFMGLVFLFGGYRAKLESMVKVRECAWAYADGACEDPPAGCALRKHEDNALVGLITGNSDTQAFKDSLDDVGAGGGAVDGGMGALGVIGDFLTGLMGLGSGFSVSADATYPRPKLFGGGDQTTTSAYSLMCNEKAWTFWDVVKGFYCQMTADEGPGC